MVALASWRVPNCTELICNNILYSVSPLLLGSVLSCIKPIMFKPPSWASQPSLTASIKVLQGSSLLEEVEIDRKAYYIFGAAADCDFQLPTLEARHHSALVHHTDSRLFLIDLQSAQGSYLDGRQLAPNKPAHVKSGVQISFGGCPQKFVVTCETAGIKRRADQMTNTVRASHILVKHRDSRRPSSWKEPTVTRSKEEAVAMVQHFRDLIVSGQAQFSNLAAEESHCSTAKRGGDLGEFGPGQMQAAFEEATLALKVNELSQPVSTDSGVHIILRTA